SVCNDGSSAAYYYSPGFGEGVNNWLILLNGGGWCITDDGCAKRLKDRTGSSIYNDQTTYFGAIRSANQAENPDFYNWNRVLVVYCDGSSFMGNAFHPRIASRGARIFGALMDELLEKGMANANNAILSGHSAGGLAAILHCDEFRALLPHTGRVKCLIDSGFFVHAPKLHGAQRRAEYFASVAAYHGFTDKLPQSCTSKMNASLCIFPENFIKNIQTPLFLLESKFDLYQVCVIHTHTLHKI
ncbi:protein notum homolog, partial [Phtheirospermum japonicum]